MFQWLKKQVSQGRSRPAVTPSPQLGAPLTDLLSLEETTMKQRRLIIVAVEEGEEPSIDYDGDFAYWEVQGALSRALELLERMQWEDEVGEEGDGEDE